jgi:hypothetical protein
MVTSHSRLRAHDHYTSSTLKGGQGGAGPSLLHTTLEGPTEYISECKMDVKSTRIPTWHQTDSVSWSLGLFSKTTSWRYRNTIAGSPPSERIFIYFQKIRFASQKLNFSIFVFSKKSVGINVDMPMTTHA